MSNTLKHIVNHFLIDISNSDDENVIEFPFNIELFCQENDEKILQLEKKIINLQSSLQAEKNKVD